MGFASGFRAGFDVTSAGIKASDERKLKEQLGQEAARYGVTEGAYGADLGQNIEQVRGLQMRAGQEALDRGASVEEVAQIENQFAPSIAELQRRQGLTAPDYSVGSRAQNFATRQEAQQTAAPMRTEGLAAVYRQAGDVEKADELEARAFEQQRGLAQETRAQAQFNQQQALGKLTLEERERAAVEQRNADSFQAFQAENPNATTQELKDAAFKQFKFTPKQWQEAVNTRLGIKENEQKDFVLDVKDKLKGKNLSQLGELYNTDPAFDDKTDLAIVPGKNGAVTLNFVDKATKRVTGSETFKSQALAVEYLNAQATAPETIGSWMLNLRAKEAQIAASNRASPGTPSLSQKVADAERALGRKLTAEEKSILVGLSSRPGTGGRAPTQAEVTARANLYIQNDQTGTLTVEDAVAMAERDLAGGPAPVSPQRSLVDAAINPQPVAPARTPTTPARATPAGQQLLGLYNTVVPPAAQRQPAPPPAQTSQERLRGFYIQQPR